MTDEPRIRILLAKVGLDTHERGVTALISAFRDAGFEVIYTGRYASPDGVARMAVQEDVDIVALSDHSGSMPIIAGGLILTDDRPVLEKMGVTGNFGPGASLDLIIDHVKSVAANNRQDAFSDAAESDR